MNLIESFVRNPVKVSVGVILVMLFGAIALYTMPVQLTPEVQIPTLTIETRWPGASPQEVEREIVLEQEEQLQSVEGLRKLTSESNVSFTFSANKTASLGLNLILLANLAWAAWLHLAFLRGRTPFLRLERWQTAYLPVYVAWSAVVVIAFPPLFGFE